MGGGGGGGSLVGSAISPRQSGVWTTAAHGTGQPQHFNDMQLKSDSDAAYESNADSARTCSSGERVSECGVRVWGRERKVFLIVSQVRGSGSGITHDQVRVVFGELLAGYLSWLSIPLLGSRLCVGMIRSWRWGAVVCGGREGGGGVANAKRGD